MPGLSFRVQHLLQKNPLPGRHASAGLTGAAAACPGTRAQGVGSLPDGLPSFDLGLNSMDIDFKF